MNNFDLDNIDSTKLDQQITTIHLCALRNEHNEGDEAGEPPTNHWTICLQVAAQSSIMLDMAPGYGDDGLRGKIEVSELAEAFTNETLRVWSYTPIVSEKDLSVRSLMETIIRHGRDAFDFSPEWEGCRYWLSVVLQDLEDAGIVSVGSAASAKEGLLMYWRNPEGSEPRIMRECVFRDAVRGDDSKNDH